MTFAQFVSVSLLNVFSQTYLQLHFPETLSKCHNAQHLINIIHVTTSHHLAFAVGDATHFSQINSHKLINNPVSPFRLLTFRPISDTVGSQRNVRTEKCATLWAGAEHIFLYVHFFVNPLCKRHLFVSLLQWSIGNL